MTVDDLASVLGTISNSLPPGYGLGEVECRMLAEHLLAGYRIEPLSVPQTSHAVMASMIAERDKAIRDATAAIELLRADARAYLATAEASVEEVSELRAVVVQMRDALKRTVQEVDSEDYVPDCYEPAIAAANRVLGTSQKGV